MTHWLPAAVLGFVLTTGGAMAGPTLLFDPGNGKVLYAEDQDDQWHPASLTKIMTAYLTFEALKSGRLTLEQKITVSENAHVLPPSKVGLPVGAEMKIDLAIRALIVKSANDVADHAGGSHRRLRRGLRQEDERDGAAPRHDAHALRQSSRPPRARAGHYGARSRQAVPCRSGRLSRASLTLGARRHADRAPPFAHAQRSAENVRRRGRPQDRLHLRLGYNVVASASRDGRKLVAVVLGESSGRDAMSGLQACCSTASTAMAGSRCSTPRPSTLLAVGEAKAGASIRTVAGLLALQRPQAAPPPDRQKAQGQAGGPPRKPTQAGKARSCRQRGADEEVNVVRPDAGEITAGRHRTV